MKPYSLIIVLWLTIPAFSQSLPQRLDSIFQHYHNKGQFDGAAFVASGGQVVYQHYFGYANRQFNVPAGPETRFPLASITKLYTAVLIFRLQESGKLHIDRPVSDYLPGDLLAAGPKITLRQLLTHASGLPGDKLADYYGKSIPSPLAFVRTQVKDTLLAEPGSRFRYNNIDYIVLGAVIEKVTGKPWRQVLREEILDPLRLANTGMIRRSLVIPGLAYGYHNYTFGTGSAQDTLYNDENPYFENYATAGGMYATAADLFRLDQALYEGSLLRAASVKEMYTPVEALGYSKYARGRVGLGSYVNSIQLKSGQQVRVWERRGSINGFNTCLLRCPDQRHTIILLCNTDTGDMEKIGDAVLEALFR